MNQQTIHQQFSSLEQTQQHSYTQTTLDLFYTIHILERGTGQSFLTKTPLQYLQFFLFPLSCQCFCHCLNSNRQ